MRATSPASMARQLERIDAIRSMVESAGQGLSQLAEALLSPPTSSDVEFINERDRPPTTATPPPPRNSVPPPTQAAPPNPVPTPPPLDAPTEKESSKKVAAFWDGDDTHIPSVTLDAPFAGQMGTGYRVYTDEDGTPNLVQVRENERIIADIEILPNGNYLYTLMDEDNLAGVYEVSPDGTSVTVRQSLPALWDKWGDFITGPDPGTTDNRSAASQFLSKLSSAATSPRETPPDLPSSPAVEGPQNPSNTPGTPEYSKRQEELALDPAKGGIKASTMHEAAVGLEAERNGSIPGPITRAELSPDGEDMGDFIDAAGTRWDVKSSPDITPPYTKDPGRPIQTPQSDEKFINMINKDIASGEKVLIDPVGMSEARKEHIRDLILAHPEWYDHVVWVNMNS